MCKLKKQTNNKKNNNSANNNCVNGAPQSAGADIKKDFVRFAASRGRKLLKTSMYNLRAAKWY